MVPERVDLPGFVGKLSAKTRTPGGAKPRTRREPHWKVQASPGKRPIRRIDWRDLVAFVSAGLAVETNMPYMAKIKDWHEVPVEGGLPPLPDFGVFLYAREDASPLALQLAGIIRDVDFDPSAIAKQG